MISRNEFNEYVTHKQYDYIEQHKVTNAIILAAGKSKRFKPISDYCPKGLSIIKGEVLVERQIKQLKAVGITDITLVVGYKKEMFFYLEDKYNVKIVVNNHYDTQEWVVTTDEYGYINDVTIGAPSGHIMLGFVYFDRQFSENFRQVILDVEGIDEYNHHVWEYLYMKHLNRLKLEIKEFDKTSILEFDTVDDAIRFDENFLTNNKDKY